MSNITGKVSGTKRRKTNLQTSDKTGDKSNDKSNPQTSPQTKPQTGDKSGDKTNPQTGDKSGEKTSPQTKPQTKPQTRPQTNITTYSDMFSGMFNNIGRKYNNKYNYYGDICAQIKETLKKDIDELTVVNYLYDYNSLLNRLKSFQAFVQRGLSNSFQDNIQVDILNNLSKQCDTEIAVCETIMSQIENISLTDIFKDYIPIFNEMNNEMSNEMNNEMNNEVEIPFIQNYVDIIEKIKIKKKCKQTLVSKCRDIIKLQAIRIKEILSDQDNILNTLERLDKNKTMKSMINYFNILSPLYVEKILKNISHVNSLLLESYLVDNLNKIYERLLKSFIEEIDPNSYVENLGMKKDRLYLYNDGSYEYNKVCQSARGTICYYMKPLYKTDDPVKEVKKYVKDVKIKKLSINGDNKTVYYL